MARYVDAFLEKNNDDEQVKRKRKIVYSLDRAGDDDPEIKGQLKSIDLEKNEWKKTNRSADDIFKNVD